MNTSANEEASQLSASLTSILSKYSRGARNDRPTRYSIHDGQRTLQKWNEHDHRRLPGMSQENSHILAITLQPKQPKFCVYL